MTTSILSICAAGAVTLAAVTHAAGQGTVFQLARFGKPALSDNDVMQIADLVKSIGRRPWTLHSKNSMIGGVCVADLYLEPDALGVRVNRGQMMKLVADGPPAVPPPWRVKASYSYAYLPPQGRQLGDIQSETDANWPFIVEGSLDDDTLISVVEFIRTEPPVPVSAFLRKVPAGPIYSISHRGDDIVVGFQEQGGSVSHTVWLARRAGQWVITRAQSAIA